jgi:hypothetical protein
VNGTPPPTSSRTASPHENTAILTEALMRSAERERMLLRVQEAAAAAYEAWLAGDEDEPMQRLHRELVASREFIL